MIDFAVNEIPPKWFKRAAKVSEYSADASEQEKITGKSNEWFFTYSKWQRKEKAGLTKFHFVHLSLKTDIESASPVLKNTGFPYICGSQQSSLGND